MSFQISELMMQLAEVDCQRDAVACVGSTVDICTPLSATKYAEAPLAYCGVSTQDICVPGSTKSVVAAPARLAQTEFHALRRQLRATMATV